LSSTSSRAPAVARRFLTGLVGSGIRASRSPALHMDEGRALGLDVHYELFDLDQIAGATAALPEVLNRAAETGYAGLNVTYPCKQQVIPLLDELSEDARALGAVNTVVFRDGRKIGHNTDWLGFYTSFRLALPDVRLDRVLQMGAGGAGSAVAYALLRAGVQRLEICDLDLTKAERLIRAMRSLFPDRRIEGRAALGRSLEGFDGLVNTTPVGMARHPGTPVPAGLLRSEMWVAEIIYFPIETELLRSARDRGCRTLDGGGMVVFQAAEALRLFTGHTPDAERMLQYFRAHYEGGAEEP
jgi:shikimate dehydrogenase